MKKIQSTCNFCALDCNLDFHVNGDEIIKVVPTKGYPVNDGFSCIKGINLDKQQTVVKTNPLPSIRQEDGSMKHVSWDEGYTYVAKKLKDIQAKYGSEAIAGISTGQLTMEEFALFGHVMRDYMQANVDGNTRLCMATAVVAHKQSYGFDAPGFTLEDLQLSDTIIFIGANPIVAHPIMWDHVRKNKNKKVIVIDPRRSETAKQADYWYGLNFRSDLVLLYAIANLLIEKDYIDTTYIAEHTNAFDEFKEFVKAYDMDRAVKETGLEAAQILELVELIHNGERVSFWWTMGINQGYEAVRGAQAIINLALMTGNIGKPGTGANSITGQCNAMSSRLYSNTAGLYGGGDYNNEARVNRVAQALHMDPKWLPKKPTLTYNQIVEGINAGEIKALWVLCTNPRHSWTNNETFAQAAKKLELFVVQDIYDTTETAEDATVMFPVCSGIRKEGTYINLERRLSGMRPILPKLKDQVSDYEAILGVGKALGMEEEGLLEGWQNPQECFVLMKECSRGMPSDITGVTWDMLSGSHGVQWPFPEGSTLDSDYRRLYTDGNFFTPNKKANFMFEEAMENPLPTTDEFPMVLNTGRGSVGQWHTQTRTKEIEYVRDVSPKSAYVFMNKRMASENNIEQNDIIRVYSINGQDAEFSVRISEDVHYNELYAPLHYIECNKLTPSLYDTYSKEPSYKATPIRFAFVRRNHETN